MKRLFFSFGVLIIVFLWILHTAATDSHAPVNGVIGDISFNKKFGHLPAPGTSENLRIKTHLEYVELISVITGLNLTLNNIQIYKADYSPLYKLGLLGGAARICSWDIHGIPLSETETAVALTLKRKL